MTLDCDFASAVSGVFDVQEPGGDWNVNAAAIVDWDERGLDRQEGDGDGTGDRDQNTGDRNRSDPFDVSAFPSASESADGELSDFVGEEQTDVFLKFVIDAEGSGGAFDTDYSFDSSVTLAYEYDDASGGDDGDGTGGDGTRGDGTGDDGDTSDTDTRGRWRNRRHRHRRCRLRRHAPGAHSGPGGLAASDRWARRARPDPAPHLMRTARE